MIEGAAHWAGEVLEVKVCVTSVSFGWDDALKKGTMFVFSISDIWTWQALCSWWDHEYTINRQW